VNQAISFANDTKRLRSLAPQGCYFDDLRALVGGLLCWLPVTFS
jgi:hypothetical protein